MRPSDIVFPDGGRPMVYLASPYAHSDKDVCKSRYWAAVKALAEAMQGQKVTVFSPIAHNHPSAVRFDLPKDWAFWRAVDFPFLEMCDMLVVLELEGWEDSRGINDEIIHAQELGIPVEYVKPENVMEFFQ